MILVIDNYDSFTYNLVQILGEMESNLKVFRNDKIYVKKALALKPERVVVSPGPCTPNEAGNSMAIIKAFAGKIPVLGVCLGHQCIAQVFGGKIVRAGKVMHGKTSYIKHDGKTIYKDIDNPFAGMRYHSLVVERQSLPECLEVSAQTKDGIIMGLRHKDFQLEGVQFHPESFMTKVGRKTLENFLRL